MRQGRELRASSFCLRGKSRRGNYCKLSFMARKSSRSMAISMMPCESCASSESKGATDVVSDEEIVAGQRWQDRHEGILVEPASAASIAGLFKCCDSHEAVYSFQKIPEASRIVCTVTGHGLKDPDAILQRMKELQPVDPTVKDVRRAIGL